MTTHVEPPAGPDNAFRHRPATPSDGMLAFPERFLWGTATSAYQIEGAVDEGGRGRSIWDEFSHTPGRTCEGHTGDIAADHYHRFDEDVTLMSRLGVRAYRFSVSWPRVQPAGSGPANETGLDFYRRLVDRLLDDEIEPWITLYHWDLPQWAQEAGGWPARDTAKRFAEYAALVHDALGDRVRYWTTLNEPWCSAFLGHGSGEHAPGFRDYAASVRAAHHLLLGHGLAIQALRERARPRDRLGIILNLYPVTPVSDVPEDQEASRWIDGLQNRLFLDPVLRGRYPHDVLGDLASVTDLGHLRDGDERVISQPLDLLGVNYYTRHIVSGRRSGHRAGRSPWPDNGPPVEFVPTGRPTTSMGWEIDSGGLVEVLTRLSREYPPVPLYVTENGAAFVDNLVDGRLADAERVRYIEAHVRAAHDAIAGGVDLRGYFVWSLLDNFEWAHGYNKRFGIVHVDFPSGRRTPKDSFRAYGDIVRRNALHVTAENQ